MRRLAPACRLGVGSWCKAARPAGVAKPPAGLLPARAAADPHPRPPCSAPRSSSARRARRSRPSPSASLTSCSRWAGLGLPQRCPACACPAEVHLIMHASAAALALTPLPTFMPHRQPRAPVLMQRKPNPTLLSRCPVPRRPPRPPRPADSLQRPGGRGVHRHRPCHAHHPGLHAPAGALCGPRRHAGCDRHVGGRGACVTPAETWGGGGGGCWERGNPAQLLSHVAGSGEVPHGSCRLTKPGRSAHPWPGGARSPATLV